MAKRAAVVSFTDKGGKLNRKIGRLLSRMGYTCLCAAPEKSAAKYGIDAIEGDYISWIGSIFNKFDVILFVGAVGIAVRGVAPYINDKLTDPAVVVVDENGEFAIPVLSGHVGGANEFAKLLADAIGSVAVITTATDINNKFAVDMFALKNNLKIIQRGMVKKISLAILNDNKVCMYCGKSITGKIPEGISKSTKGHIGFSISVFSDSTSYSYTLNLVPKKVHIGIGCRKGTPENIIKEAADIFFEETKIFKEAVCRVATITLKHNERGLIDYCSKMGWPVTFFSSENLNKADGDFISSDFVKKITGTDNVCERAAVLSANNGQLIACKTVREGVCIAAACEDWSVDFG